MHAHAAVPSVPADTPKIRWANVPAISRHHIFPSGLQVSRAIRQQLGWYCSCHRKRD